MSALTFVRLQKLCLKVGFWRPNPKIGYQKINDLRVSTFLFSVICDRAQKCDLIVCIVLCICMVCDRLTPLVSIASRRMFPPIEPRRIAPSAAGPASGSTIDRVFRPHYNTPTRLGYGLTKSGAVEQDPAYAAYAFSAIRSASRAAMRPCSRAFLEEAATPQPWLVSSPAGGASPASIPLLCLQR